MSESVGTDESESLSDEDWSNLLNFDLPNNDQTWLFCAPGDDPNLVVDLEKALKYQKLNEDHTPKEATGIQVDTKTYVVKKPKYVIRPPTEALATSKIKELSPDEDQKKIESPSTKIPLYSPSAVKGIKQKSLVCDQNKENLPQNSNETFTCTEPSVFNLTTDIGSHGSHIPNQSVSGDTVLLENISYPQSFFIDQTMCECTLSPAGSSSQKMQPSGYLLNTTYDKSGKIAVGDSEPRSEFSGVDTDSIKFESTPSPFTPLMAENFVFKPPLESTPKSNPQPAERRKFISIRPFTSCKEALERESPAETNIERLEGGSSSDKESISQKQIGSKRIRKSVSHDSLLSHSKDQMPERHGKCELKKKITSCSNLHQGSRFGFLGMAPFQSRLSIAGKSLPVHTSRFIRRSEAIASSSSVTEQTSKTDRPAIPAESTFTQSSQSIASESEPSGSKQTLPRSKIPRGGKTRIPLPKPKKMD